MSIMKRIKFPMMGAVIALLAMLCPALNAGAEVHKDVEAVCVILDTVSEQLDGIGRGKMSDINATLMQLLPYTASTVTLDAEAKERIGQSALKMVEASMALSGQKLNDEQRAAMKAEITKDMEDENVLGPFVTDTLADLMGGQ